MLLLASYHTQLYNYFCGLFYAISNVPNTTWLNVSILGAG
jgi:hypothetical protein